MNRAHLTVRVSVETRARIEAYAEASGVSVGRVIDMVVAASALTTGAIKHVTQLCKERGQTASDVLDEIIKTHHHQVTNMGPVRHNGGYL